MRDTIKRLAIVGLLMLAVAGPGAFADWKVRFVLAGEWRYDTNVYNRSASQIADFNAQDPAAAVSGKYKDMNSIADNILRPSFEMRASGRGLGGRKMDVTLALDYSKYLENDKKDHFAVGMAIRQSIWKGGALTVEGSYDPKQFQRNFLVDAVAESDGSVLPENRIYGAGTYREARGGATFEQRLIERNKKSRVGVTGRIGVDYYARRYPSEFTGRDRDSLDLQAGLGMDFKGGWGIDLVYRHENAESPVVSEILILDEGDFGTDFNGDGDTQDQNIRTAALVDRSFRADRLEGTMVAPLAKRTDLRLRAARRLKTFLSVEPYDGYRGRKDKRWILGAELDHKFGSGWSAAAGYNYNSQVSSRADVTGDEEDYLKHVVWAGISFRF